MHAEAGGTVWGIGAVAPETPDALNLAGKLQATNDRERKAGEILTAANTKLTAGDASTRGRRCSRCARSISSAPTRALAGGCSTP